MRFELIDQHNSSLRNIILFMVQFFVLFIEVSYCAAAISSIIFQGQMPITWTFATIISLFK